MKPDDAADIRAAFDAAINMTAEEIAAWLETPQSGAVGWIRPGEAESVGRQSARRIIAILGARSEDLGADDYAHMRKVAGFVRRHRAQRPLRDIMHTRWRYSLMNWGHDPLKDEL